MIWATVTPQGLFLFFLFVCFVLFCFFADSIDFLHLQLNIINLISYWPSGNVHVLNCLCAVGRRYLLWPVHALGRTLWAFALLQSVIQGQTCLLLQVSLDFLFCTPVPYGEKNIFFLVLVLCLLQIIKFIWNATNLEKQKGSWKRWTMLENKQLLIARLIQIYTNKRKFDPFFIYLNLFIEVRIGK